MDHSRSIVSRDFAPVRRHDRSGPVVALVERPLIELPPTVGASDCQDWIDRAKHEAEACLKRTNFSQQANANACNADGSPGPCGEVLRTVCLGGVNAAAIPAPGSGEIVIEIEANFMPVMLQVDPAAIAGNTGARVTEIKYGPASKLINPFVLLAQFDVTGLTGGYRLKHPIFLTAGQKIRLTVFTPVGGFAADTLVINAFGYTDSP